MAYNFGQFRRSQYNSYLTDLPFTVNNLVSKSTFLEGTSFYDKKISLTDKILKPVSANNLLRSYYLKIKIYKQTDIQNITLKMVDDTKQEDNEQGIELIKVPAGNTTDYVIYDFVLKPNSNYNQIYLILSRTMADYNIDLGNGFYGRQINLEIIQVQEITNLLETYLPSRIDHKRLLKQIGVQGPPGMLMSIDGEGIRIGRTGIYEINYGISISFIGFIIDSSDTTNFILNYQY